MSRFFNGFTTITQPVQDGTLQVRVGGEGPPVLLLHGNPQSSAVWHAVAPGLAARHRVICPDLRGYGGSFHPAVGADPAAFSKRAMARDMAQLMTALGHGPFAVIGQDRGARVAHSLALAEPGRVRHLGVLDVVPTIAHFGRQDMSWELGLYPSCWAGDTHPFPEELENAAPADPRRARRSGGTHVPGAMQPGDAVMSAKLREAYRQAAIHDLEQDRIARAAGQRVACPALVLWASDGRLGGWYDPLALWRDYCAGPVSGAAVRGGHDLAEDAPGAVVQAVVPFLA